MNTTTNPQQNIPLVTIGIPLFNEALYVRRTLNSALNQTYRNIEIIVSDNSSSDSTYDILTSEFKDVENMRIYRQPKNIGPNANFEFVMHQANGEFFMWLGGHDSIHEEYIAEAVQKHATNPESSLVYFNHQYVDSEFQMMETPVSGDIASVSESADERALKVFSNLYYCTQIHGLWRTKFRNVVKFTYNFGPDHLVLFILAIQGPILEIDKPWYFRTMNRTAESQNESLKRYASYGYKGDFNDAWFTTVKSHLNYCLRNFRLSLFWSIGRREKKRFKHYIRGFHFFR